MVKAWDTIKLRIYIYIYINSLRLLAHFDQRNSRLGRPRAWTNHPRQKLGLKCELSPRTERLRGVELAGAVMRRNTEKLKRNRIMKCGQT